MQNVEQERFEILFTEKEILEKVDELGKQISQDYNNNKKDLVLIGILNGAFMFTSDLAKAIEHPDVYVDFMQVSSYSEGDQSTREPKILSDTKRAIKETDVIIVEDIVDTGYSIDTLLKILDARGPNSITVCSLLSKPSRREIEVPINYLGFEIGDLWVLGYGLDENGKYRTERNIIRKIAS
jgi:hypoxanthine phosphoribosyltransferase